ncbi:LysM peptidoglycan-binding domain-containing protein [Lihuaxuella thermophila]|uniref:LysM domain-containing protein n=1 Tax=Lihuaxuella thermophila TaxID=1173111 RepID=A0A1H8FT36_9BACL|nr:LysM domain-containing protein [Lihuaxuella thermophila]SEN34856.1 LysM domain-containing protein [Lihuaxuella thermophila]
MKIHIVRTGETIWDLAQKYNTPKERLIEANPEIKSKEQLVPGMKIRIPTGRIPINRQKGGEEEAHSDREAAPAEEVVQNQETGERDESTEPSQDLHKEESSFSEEKAESPVQETKVDTDSPEEPSLFPTESPHQESVAKTESLYGETLFFNHGTDGYPSPYFSTYPHVKEPKLSGYYEERESKYHSGSPYRYSSEFDMVPPPPMISYYPAGAYWYAPPVYTMMPDPSAFVMAPPSPYMPMPGQDFSYPPYPYPHSQPQTGWHPPLTEPWMGTDPVHSVESNRSVQPVMIPPERSEKESSSREY